MARQAALWPNDIVKYTYANRLRASLSVPAPNGAPWAQSYGYDPARRLTGVSSPAGFNLRRSQRAVEERPHLTLDPSPLPRGAEREIEIGHWYPGWRSPTRLPRANIRSAFSASRAERDQVDAVAWETGMGL